MLKIAITGSSGFVGKRLVNKLAKSNVDIIEIDLKSGFDILKTDSLNRIETFDVLIHLAAKSYVPDSFKYPASFYYTNIIGTLNVLELCRKFNARIIFTSSYVYGGPDYLPIDELHPLKAFNPYAQSKLIGEDLCIAYARDYDIPYTIFRPFNIFGPNQNSSFLIPQILIQARTGLITLKDPRPKRDFIYIDDVVEAYISAIDEKLSFQEVLNLGSGRSYSIEFITQIIEKYFNNTVKTKFLNVYRKNEILDTVADVSKAKELLCWKPTVSLKEGILKILNEYK